MTFEALARTMCDLRDRARDTIAVSAIIPFLEGDWDVELVWAASRREWTMRARLHPEGRSSTVADWVNAGRLGRHAGADRWLPQVMPENPNDWIIWVWQEVGA